MPENNTMKGPCTSFVIFIKSRKLMYYNYYYENFFYKPEKRNYVIYYFWNIDHAG